jgi:hypothetical protein
VAGTRTCTAGSLQIRAPVRLRWSLSVGTRSKSGRSKEGDATTLHFKMQFVDITGSVMTEGRVTRLRPVHFSRCSATLAVVRVTGFEI